MKPGDVVLAVLPQANGSTKLRPAILLRRMPPFGDFLVCGVSSQLQQEAKGFDETISWSDNDFKQSGLAQPSLIRLGYLSVFPKQQIPGTIGSLSPSRHQRLLQNLSDYLIAESK